MNALTDFGRDRRGAVAMIFCFAFIMLGICIGLAIDTARVYSVSRKVQSALDSAAIEGAKLLNEDSSRLSLVRQRAYSSFVSNTGSLSSSDALLSGFTAVADTSNSLINISVNVRVPTTFGKLAGLENFNFVKVASSNYSMAQLEVVLALDVTGSMGDIPAGDTRSKMESMKVAAVALVNQLFDEATSDHNVRISVVPWSSGVHPGSFGAAVTGVSGGANCIVERAGAGATSDSLPGPGTYAQPMPAAATAAGYACPSRAVSPLEGRNRRNNITSQIQALTSAGGTAGHIGAAWAWNMISPTWASLHEPDSRPAPASPNVIKSVIIMTDGIYNSSFVGGSTPVAGTLYDDASYAMFQTTCEGMRNQHIIVHTVAFDLTDTRALGELSSCSTSGTVLTAANSGELTEVFSQMVAQLTSLRLTR